ncbi:MAG: flavin reductase family protein [Chloroflexota bacterium]
MIAENISQGLHLIPNGVFIVASAHGGEVHGFTASWVSQASYRNPLLTVAIDKKHDTYRLIQGSRKLVINILRASQKDVAEHFGHERHPSDGQYFREENGQTVPVLNDCVAAIFCNVVGTMDARDHEVLLVEATDSLVITQGQPLVFWPSRGYVELK